MVKVHMVCPYGHVHMVTNVFYYGLVKSCLNSQDFAKFFQKFLHKVYFNTYFKSFEVLGQNVRHHNLNYHIKVLNEVFTKLYFGFANLYLISRTSLTF